MRSSGEEPARRDQVNMTLSAAVSGFDFRFAVQCACTSIPRPWELRHSYPRLPSSRAFNASPREEGGSFEASRGMRGAPTFRREARRLLPPPGAIPRDGRRLHWCPGRPRPQAASAWMTFGPADQALKLVLGRPAEQPTSAAFSGRPLARTPITGIADCCARATTGQRPAWSKRSGASRAIALRGGVFIASGEVGAELLNRAKRKSLDRSVLADRRRISGGAGVLRGGDHAMSVGASAS
jgi:hypothetical protein